MMIQLFVCGITSQRCMKPLNCSAMCSLRKAGSCHAQPKRILVSGRPQSFAVKDTWGLTVRRSIGIGVKTVCGLHGMDQSTLFWWPKGDPDAFRSLTCHSGKSIQFHQIFGEDWKDMCWIQFLTANDLDMQAIKRINPDDPH